MPELKSCPFCGNDNPTICLDFRKTRKSYFGYCNICGVKTRRANTKNEIIKIWNRRTNNANS